MPPWHSSGDDPVELLGKEAAQSRRLSGSFPANQPLDDAPAPQARSAKSPRLSSAYNATQRRSSTELLKVPPGGAAYRRDELLGPDACNGGLAAVSGREDAASPPSTRSRTLNDPIAGFFSCQAEVADPCPEPCPELRSNRTPERFGRHLKRL